MKNKQAIQHDQIGKNEREAIAAEILNRLEKGMSLQAATGVSDEALEEIYSLAYSYYDQGKYKESAALFQFLAGASPDTYKFVLGLASSLHQLEIFGEAVVGFYIAFNIEPTNPIPAYYVTDCLLKQNMKKEADEFAEITALVCGDFPQYQDLKERCELIRKSLKVKK